MTNNICAKFKWSPRRKLNTDQTHGKTPYKQIPNLSIRLNHQKARRGGGRRDPRTAANFIPGHFLHRHGSVVPSGWTEGPFRAAKGELRGAHEIYMKRSHRSDRTHNERHGTPLHCPRSFAERTGCTGYAPLATMAKSPPKNRDPWREHLPPYPPPLLFHCLFRCHLHNLVC